MTGVRIVREHSDWVPVHSICQVCRVPLSSNAHMAGASIVVEVSPRRRCKCGEEDQGTKQGTTKHGGMRK